MDEGKLLPNTHTHSCPVFPTRAFPFPGQWWTRDGGRERTPYFKPLLSFCCLCVCLAGKGRRARSIREGKERQQHNASLPPAFGLHFPFPRVILFPSLPAGRLFCVGKRRLDGGACFAFSLLLLLPASRQAVRPTDACKGLGGKGRKNVGLTPP